MRSDAEPSASGLTLSDGEVIERLQRALPRAWQGMIAAAADGWFTLPHPSSAIDAWNTLWTAAARQPERVLATQMRLLAGWTRSAARLLVPGVPDPAATAVDRRFRAGAWREHPGYAELCRHYRLWSEQMLALADAVTADCDAHTAAKARFYARQLVNALSPANSPAGNPEVVEQALRTGGRSWLHGSTRLLEDLAAGRGRLRISHADRSAYTLGRDLAATPGQVVWENRLMQLIQYMPAGQEVRRRPILILPPWINKYYVLDLSPQRSLVRWLVEQGHSVFLMSWVNPGAELAGCDFDDYLTDGSLAAIEAVCKETGEDQINAVGYCIGGTLLACTLAWLAGNRLDRVASATFLTTLLDFSDVGELSVFIDEQQIALLEGHMARHGFLDGCHLANAFNALQENDLVWSYWVNNYLMGRPPRDFDLLVWNGDSTRMPARMHSRYLRECYLHNRLREPGAMVVAGTPLDLGAIRVPAVAVATERDHIAPWQSCYRSARLLGGPTRFVLAGSGHVAGIVNPAGSGRYGYRTHARMPAGPAAWMAGSRRSSGSWWPWWGRWLDRHSAGRIAARSPGAGGLGVIEPAPGRYVRVRSDDDRQTGSGGPSI